MAQSLFTIAICLLYAGHNYEDVHLAPSWPVWALILGF